MAEKKPYYKFYNIVVCNPGKEKIPAEDVIELYEKTGIDIALYSLTLHPEGYPATLKRDRLVESYRKFAKLLKGTKVRPGVLIQSILGHWPRVDKKEEKWTRTINIDGNVSRFCPFDPKFRKYIFETVAMLAKEKPCFILGDDDIRAFSPRAECFCKLHTEEFNRRAGTNFTPEEYRLAVQNSKKGDRIFETFNLLRKDTVKSVASLIREAIDSVDPSIPAGTCQPGWEIREAHERSILIAARGQNPVLRIGNDTYMEQTTLTLPGNVLTTQTMRAWNADMPELLDESDTCPHNLYSKSAVGLHAKICTAILSGLTGSKIWYVNGHKNNFPVSRKYTQVLAANMGLYQELARTMRKAVPQGIMIPGYREASTWHPYHNLDNRIVPEKNWVGKLFGLYGIPFRGVLDLDKEGIYAVAGKESAERLSDEEVMKLLSHKLLLDGPAAAELCRRGFAKYMGVKAELKEFSFNREISADGKQAYPFSKTKDVPFLKVTDKNAKILTDICYAPSAASPDLEKVCPGVVISRNSLGGTVCTTAFHEGVLWVWASDVRKLWLINLLEKLNGKKLDYYVDEFQWVTLIHNKLDSGKDLLGIFNIAYDAMESISVACAKKPARVEYLNGEGKWKELSFEWKNNRMILPVYLSCFSELILRIS